MKIGDTVNYTYRTKPPHRTFVTQDAVVLGFTKQRCKIAYINGFRVQYASVKAEALTPRQPSGERWEVNILQIIVEGDPVPGVWSNTG